MAGVAEALFDLSRFGRRTALVEGDCTYTYAQLDGLARAVAEPCAPRSVAFVLCRNTVACVAGYVGLINRGIVPLLLAHDINHDLLARLIEAYTPSYLWVPEAAAAPEGYDQELMRLGGYHLLASGGERPLPVLHPDLALLMATSGSTGSPKLVRQSYANLRANTRSIIEFLGITAAERAITSLPLNYVYGLSVVNTHLFVGATLVLTDLACYGKGFWDVFRAQECTSFAGVPFTYEMLDRLHFTTRMEVPTLRTMTQAGGKLDPALQERFARYGAAHGVDFVVMYGASEATARMGYLPPAHALDKQGSMGVPIPGGRFELVDTEGHVIQAAGEPGELIYYGPNVTLGYADGVADLARGDDNGGRLATGDIAQRDSDGFYYIVGRAKRFIKIVGRRVNLDEVERLLVRNLGTPDVACSGSDDLLTVFVTSEEHAHEAVEQASDIMGINRRMVAPVVVAEIPKSGSGKTLYHQLDELVRARGVV